MKLFKQAFIAVFLISNISFASDLNVSCTGCRYGLVKKDIAADITSDMALLEFDFKNESEMRTVTGIKYVLTLKDPFGATISQQELQFNCKILPASADSDRKCIEDNQFNKNDLYDRVYDLISNETLGVSVEVTKIAYDTGLVKDNDNLDFMPQNAEELNKLIQKAQEVYQNSEESGK